ncbi:unnamed protein product [Adineta steineri]|uniref:LamG-like jellyroll fold domain-containing protein n=1 Tax=Adineta steineri TaxID=433720 RepID=A0A814AS32_9BILA|nr:unnamed protein product [Adineta steineri]CAF0919354.1 unnamed protein product [Adineta steineri]
MYGLQRQSNKSNDQNFEYNALALSTLNGNDRDSSRNTIISSNNICPRSTNLRTADESTTNRSTGSDRKIFGVGLFVGILAAGIALTTVTVLWKHSGSASTTSPTTVTTTTASTTTTVTTTTTAPLKAFWAFDGTLQDLYNNFNGIGRNGITYLSPGYNGAGSCLWLNRSMNQSVVINNPPFLNMSYTSLTLEVWIYAQTLCNSNPYTDNSIFGQLDQGTQDRTLHFIIRNQRIYLGFFLDDDPGTQILNTKQWYHLAYVYDYSINTQYVYVNGYLDTSRSSSGPYQGMTGPVTIGTIGLNASNDQFDGCLDSMAYYNWAKNATEILNDATLVVYLSFNGDTLLDSGPLKINGTGTNYSYTSAGRINQSISLSGSSSYVQVTGLTRLGINGWPYSFAVWIKPTSLAGGTIIHLSSRTDGAQIGGWCLPMMGLTSSGQIAIDSWNSSNVPLTGPQAPLNIWTHVVTTYSPTSGLKLYINGTLWSSVGAYTFAAGSIPMTITLGNSLLGTSTCNTATIQMGQFYGSIDEFYVYARELTTSEVTSLANP